MRARGAAVLSPHGTRAVRHLAAAFTLVELMVVVGIIVLLLAITVPAIGPMLTRNEAAQAINTLTGLCITAQSAAEMSATPVAIRIERAFEVKKITFNNQPYEAMRDFTRPGDEPEFLDHQQARLVQFTSEPAPAGLKARNEPYQPAFEQIRDTRVTPLPKTAWLAPIECIERDASGKPVADPFNPSRQLWSLDDASLIYQPRRVEDVLNGSSSPGTNPHAVPFNRMDTFYIVFDRFGGVRHLRTSPSDYAGHYWFRDLSQPYEDPDALDPSKDSAVYPLVDHPDASARGVLVYDRTAFTELPNSDAERRALLEKSRPLYVSRSLGAMVEGRQ